MPLQVGNRIPEFYFFDSNHKERNSKEFIGTKTLFAFFPGAFTDVCTDELCQIDNMMNRFNDSDVKVIGISSDSPFALNAWATQNGISYDLISDYNLDCIDAFGVSFTGLAGLPNYRSSNRAVFVADQDGILVYSWMGEHPGIIPDYDSILNHI
jgi:peroxiredoxin